MKNEILEKDIEMLKALAHPVRLQIVKELISRGMCNVTELHEVLNLSQPTISHHLSKLRDNDVVINEREGREVYYYIENVIVNSVIEALSCHS